MIALLTTSMVVVLAFVTDFGMAWSNKQALQNGADAAALAVAQEIAITAPADRNCAWIEANMGSAMRAKAEEYFAANTPGGGSLKPGNEGFQITCTASGQPVVRVTGGQDSQVFFGHLAGVSKIPVQQSAKALVAPVNRVIGVRPFAICQADANRIKTSTLPYAVSFDNADAGCGYAPGNWAVMDFNGGANSTVELAEWVLRGYSGPISVAPPVYLPGNPGAPNPGAIDAEMTAVLDKEVVLPVFDALTGQGQGSSFRITGFLGVQICGWKFNHNTGTGTCGSTVANPPQNYLQVRFRRFIAIGDLNLSCPVADPTCDNGQRGFALAE